MSADPRLPEIAKRLEAVEKLVDETAEVVSPSKEDEAQWRQRARGARPRPLTIRRSRGKNRSRPTTTRRPT